MNWGNNGTYILHLKKDELSIINSVMLLDISADCSDYYHHHPPPTYHILLPLLPSYLFSCLILCHWLLFPQLLGQVTLSLSWFSHVHSSINHYSSITTHMKSECMDPTCLWDKMDDHMRRETFAMLLYCYGDNKTGCSAICRDGNRGYIRRK